MIRFVRICCVVLGATAFSLPAICGDFAPPQTFTTPYKPVSIAPSKYRYVPIDVIVISSSVVGLAPVSASTYLSMNGGSFNPSVDKMLPGISGAALGVPGDFDGDGFPDLCVFFNTALFPAHGSVEFFRGKGDGTFYTPVTVSESRHKWIAGVGLDLNFDFKGDMLAVAADGTIVSFLGVGGGAFTVTESASSAAGVVAATFGRITTSGQYDVVTASAPLTGGAPFLQLSRGNGDGTFQPASAIAFNAATEITAVTSGDLTGDGIADLALTDAAGQKVFALAGNGTGVFSEVARIDATGAPHGIVAIDLTCDGVMDLATADTGANTVTLYRGLGPGTFAPGVSYATGGGPALLAAADINSDGKPDLVTGNTTPNGSSVLLNTASTVAPGTCILP